MAAGTVAPGRLRRRLVVALVLVAGLSAGMSAAGSYLMLRQARFDGSLQRAAADARYQLVVAAQFLPLTEARRADLLASFEEAGRHVLLVAGGTRASNPRYAPTPGAGLRATVAAGQLDFQRTPGRPHLLVVGGRIPGSTAELLLADEIDALPAGAVRAAELLVADVVRLRRLVEDLLEISRLDAGAGGARGAPGGRRGAAAADHRR
ncbi:hypothetical protein [Micromonospora sp. WMMD980]|uniref:hypothetical protein n=1 Tax=Micromonospora sp. WMMD980 TaxID=3016088 RepID=UPI002416ABFC|nr:hypothetical protein [Micromonospora sp. WMMD980]MDG4800635.1 hypothetical protein [Micromonospora sp. WMMD980]